MFEAHAATLVAAADALQQARRRRRFAPARASREIHPDREHDADEIIRQVLIEVRRTFLTPFDRGAITSLIGAMDDAIDEMLAAARAIDLYELQRASAGDEGDGRHHRRSRRITAEAMPLLREHQPQRRQAPRASPAARQPRRRSGRHSRHRSEARLPGTSRDEPLQFTVAREVYKNLERVTDAFEDVANEIDGIVIDHA